MDITLGLANSTLGLVDRTLDLADSTLGFVDITLGLADSTLGLVDRTLGLAVSTLRLVDRTLTLGSKVDGFSLNSEISQTHGVILSMGHTMNHSENNPLVYRGILVNLKEDYTLDIDQECYKHVLMSC